ncbi:hypothetical protein Vqi01_46730 [Micromonospora qiuiae]|uniref:Polyketide synthase n=1 Tax=Micromonospora qiuiae TaxID=502268 RepID=A0ABQ4JGJ1_9ACTN|nr:beta-ketoacyl synthase N-terminal-like domain-containing protein [Micromonospora qiuiae]GIJ29511.1 hypothetical protein Vqi01_46730 [Micromonospora qiuiae]
MTTASDPPAIGDFQLVVRPRDPVVRDHLVRGVPVLPEASYLDVLYRAAILRGIPAESLELRDIRFTAPLAVAGNGERSLVFRSATTAEGTRVTATARSTEDGVDEAVAECVVITAPGASRPADFDPSAYRERAGAPLDTLYSEAESAGVVHGRFLRARGWVAKTGSALVAEVSLDERNRRPADDFLLHPALLDAALVAAASHPSRAGEVHYRPTSIGRFRAWGALDSNVFVVVHDPPNRGDANRIDLYGEDGRLVARFEAVTFGPAAKPAARQRPAVSVPVRAERPTGARVGERALDIAIVGIAGRYPGADDVDELWANLLAGHDAVGPVPDSRWRAEAYPTGELTLPAYGGFLSDVDAFDPRFFRIPPSTAADIDPQERLFLQTAYAAVENAGYQPSDFRAPANRVGVFVGATWTDYRLLGVEATRRGTPRAVPSTLSSIANRVSYYFDLTGPSMAVDTVCSSSLTALHLACGSIAAGECDAAIAGGVNLLLHPDKYLLLRTMNLDSSDGRCRSFGADGDGYVPGEGVGALFLKPLAQARADGDTIYGVILGSAANHGGRAAGMTVPNPVAQGEAITRALTQARIDPDGVDYVEAHGTGTALGDPVEVAGLSRAFAGRTRPCWLGSVKSNIGHLEAAAGVAAVTKALLQLRHDRIVPSLHSAQLNPDIDFEASPWRVPQAVERWPEQDGSADPRPRRAGVSSFGAGGSNVHVVIEEYLEAPLPVRAPAPELLVLSARTEERLREYAQRVAKFLRDNGDRDFGDIARTFQVGRPAMPVRLAVVASDAASSADFLARYLSGGDCVYTGVATGPGDVAALAASYAAADLAGAAELWVAGATPDWAAVNGGPRRRVPVPGYPFERTRFWIEGISLSERSSPEARTTAAPATGPAYDTTVGSTVATWGRTEVTGSDSVDSVIEAYDRGLVPVDEELEAAYPALGRYAALVVLDRFRRMGLPPQGGTAEQLRAAMDIQASFQRFFDACLDVLIRHDCLLNDGEWLRPVTHTEDPASLRARLLARYPEAASYVRLLDVCIEAYPDTLRGRQPATEVLFPGSGMDLMAGIYQGNRAYDFYSAEIGRLLACTAQVNAASGRDPVRVLEIGAGTGSTSHAVLAALAACGVPVEYHYTDIGGSFVAHGRRTFAERYPFTRYRVLDAERDPISQGFPAGAFDAVLAASALHAVSDIDAALARVRRLLNSTGLLVLGEPVSNHDVMSVTVGLLDGWHSYLDPQNRLPNSPLLSVQGWQSALRRSGYEGFVSYGPGMTADPKPSYRIIVAGAGEAAAADGAADGAAGTGGVAAAPAPTDEAPRGDRPEILEPVLTEIIAEGLGVPVDEVRPTLSFAEYGVDSILAMKLVRRINDTLGISVKPTVVFDHPSVRSLAAYASGIGARLDRDGSAPEAPAPAPPPAVAPAPSPAVAPVTPPPMAPVTPAAPVAPATPPAPAATTPARPVARAERGESLDIAIIGMSARYPGARDYREFWRNLMAGHDTVTEVPADRWNLDEIYAPWPPQPGRTYARWGGYLDEADRFDPYFFGITPAEADFMDPQQRMFLEESWRAIEDAGLDAHQLKRVRFGVFAGSPPPDYPTLVRQRGLSGAPHTFTGNSPAILPARVAYHLDLTGPCLGVDTACSSSLVALNQACQSLVAGECDMALAGGVAVYATPEHLLMTSSIGMLSPTGRCRAFDESGDGIAIGEGVGVVVLKPLAQALADGDPIHGVIKGIGVNQDGRTNGITAPSARSQTELQLAVYERYGIDPGAIGYVEAHGTGTKLGDPIEIEALTAAFRRYTDRRGTVPIGSVKTNIGHSAHAAGVASLVKVLMSLRNGHIPASLNFTTENPISGLAESPFFVNTELRPWADDARLAAISSFGFSGTNVHMVVEGHADTRPATAAGQRQALVTLSARTPESLRAAAAGLERFLGGTPDVALHDVAATVQLGRAAFEHRLAVVAGSVDQLRAQLSLVATGQTPRGAYFGEVPPEIRPPAPIPLTPDTDLAPVGEAWVAGAAFDFRGLYADGAVRRIHLPGYAFARERYWLPDVEPAAVGVPPESRLADQRPASTLSLEQVRTEVTGAAAAELGVHQFEVDLAIPAEQLGFDEVSRGRLLARVNDAYGIDLRVDVFASGVSLDAFVEQVAAAARVVPRTPPVRPAPAPAAARPAPVPAGAESAPAEMNDDDLVRRAEDYLKRAFAAESRLPLERIRTRAPLQDYGIDSVLIANLNQRLGETFDGLSSTLFFEYQTIHELACHLASDHAERLVAVTSAVAPTATVPAATVPAATVPAPAVTAVTTARVEAVVERAGEPVTAPRSSTTDIAVIGMSGRYPMARDNDELWENLLAGRDCIVEVPKDRWDHSRYVSEERDQPGTTYAKWGGFIDDVDKFDARFFQITPREAEEMDPQQRLFLETAWAALEDAGYTPDRVRGTAQRRGRKDAGVFVGVTYGEYQLYLDIPIVGYWAVANRVSYHMGFNGPSMAVDTACSASMTALHLAVESLRRGECSYAIAGGVNISIHPGKFLLLGAGHWASSDGRCRAFGEGGDGYVPGEGVAALILKPLEDARADGDRVYGVIRGSAVNHGGRTNGFTVPNPSAQAALVREALAQAGVDPLTVGYVEAHGTGTALGDPIEIAALTKAFNADLPKLTSDRPRCVVGSAKASIGHLEAAAGVAGVVKTLLQLQHETIAPSPHSAPANPNIDFAASPFQVAQHAMPWRRGPEGPRLAAVSSFGAGGANAHVVLQEYDQPLVTPTGNAGPYLVVLSARRAERLGELAGNLARFLRSPRGLETPLADVAWTLMVGRVAFEHRLATAVQTREELAVCLAEFAAGTLRPGVVVGTVPTHQDTVDGESAADRQYLRALRRDGQLRRLAELWTQGWAVDWAALHDTPAGRPVSLPTYPFARERHWIVPEDYRREPGLVLETPAEALAAMPIAEEATVSAVQDAGASPATDSTSLRAELQLRVQKIFSELTRIPVEELDPESDFLDFGFDSVASVRMLNRLMKHYGVRIPGSAIEEYCTIRSFTDHLVDSGLITIGGAAGATLVTGLAAVLTEPARAVTPVRTPAPLEVESVFLTGVTGVLGGRLLYDLLATTSVRVTCLVRADSPSRAMERIGRLLSVYDEEGRLTDALRDRVTAVLGDVSQDRLGLDETTLARLMAETDATIHVAAVTKLVTFYDSLAPINVDGTQRMIDFALGTRHKYLMYVSSFSALGDYLLADNRPFTEHDIELGQRYDHLPYQETKYHAEKLIRAATDEGLLWNIFRPGNIMGDSRTGRYPFTEVTVKGAYYDIFKTVVDTGISAAAPNHWDITPVDYVSAGMLYLGLRHPSYRETYHLTNPDIKNLSDIFGYMQACGYRMREVTIEEYHRMATERLFRSAGSDEPYDSQTIEMIKYGVETWGPEHYAHSSAPDCAYTRQRLVPAGIVCPTVAELVVLYLDHCVRVGFLPPPAALASTANGHDRAARAVAGYPR